MFLCLLLPHSCSLVCLSVSSIDGAVTCILFVGIIGKIGLGGWVSGGGLIGDDCKVRVGEGRGGICSVVDGNEIGMESVGNGFSIVSFVSMISLVSTD